MLNLRKMVSWWGTRLESWSFTPDFFSTQAVALQMELWSRWIEDKLFQSSGHLEDAKVQFWRPNDIPIFTIFWLHFHPWIKDWLGTQLASNSYVNWTWIRTWIEDCIDREFGRESKTNLGPFQWPFSAADSTTDLAPNWPAIRTWIRTWIEDCIDCESKTNLGPVQWPFPWIEDRLGRKFKTFLPFSLVEIYFECFVCVSGLSAQIFRLEQNHGDPDEIPTKLVPNNQED